MSRIEIVHGAAIVSVESSVDRHERNGRRVVPYYPPADVLDAAWRVLLAIDTPESTNLATRVRDLVAVNLGPRRAEQFPETDTTVPPPL